jgi:hypothetical protein
MVRFHGDIFTVRYAKVRLCRDLNTLVRSPSAHLACFKARCCQSCACRSPKKLTFGTLVPGGSHHSRESPRAKRAAVPMVANLISVHQYG